MYNTSSTDQISTIFLFVLSPEQSSTPIMHLSASVLIAILSVAHALPAAQPNAQLGVHNYARDEANSASSKYFYAAADFENKDKQDDAAAQA